MARDLNVELSGVEGSGPGGRIVKADVGLKDGKIHAIGKAGNPGIMDGVTAGMEIGARNDQHASAAYRCHLICRLGQRLIEDLQR